MGLAANLDPVGKGRGGGECPAAAAVNGNVLVALHSQIVGAVHIAPPVIFGEVGGGDFRNGFEHAGLEGGGGFMLAIHGDVHGDAEQHQQA